MNHTFPSCLCSYYRMIYVFLSFFYPLYFFLCLMLKRLMKYRKQIVIYIIRYFDRFYFEFIISRFKTDRRPQIPSTHYSRRPSLLFVSFQTCKRFFSFLFFFFSLRSFEIILFDFLAKTFDALTQYLQSIFIYEMIYIYYV